MMKINVLSSTSFIQKSFPSEIKKAAVSIPKAVAKNKMLALSLAGIGLMNAVSAGIILKNKKSAQEKTTIENSKNENLIECSKQEKIPQNSNNLAFSGAYHDNDDIEPMKDSEFEYLKKSTDTKIKENNLKQYLNSADFTKENILIANKILSNEKLSCNRDFMQKAGKIVRSTKTPYEQYARLDMLDKILSDDRLSENPDFMKEAGNIIFETDSLELLQAKTTMVDKILSCDKLLNNQDFMKKAGEIVRFNDSLADAQGKCAVIDKILSDKRLVDSPEFMKKAGSIVEFTCKEDAKEKCMLLDEILSSKWLCNNPESMENAGYIVECAYDSNKAKVASKILSDKRLLNNEDFLEYADEIFAAKENKNTTKIACGMIDRILSDKMLADNPDIIAWLGYAIGFIAKHPNEDDKIRSLELACEFLGEMTY